MPAKLLARDPKSIKCKMLTLTFLPLIMTTTSLCYFIIMCAYLWSLFLFLWKTRNWLKPGRDYIIYQRAENVIFPPKARLCTICLLSPRGHKGFNPPVSLSLEGGGSTCSRVRPALPPALPLPLSFGMWRPPASVAARIDVRRGCALIEGPPYLQAVFSGALQRGRLTTGWSIMLASLTWVMLRSHSSGGEPPVTKPHRTLLYLGKVSSPPPRLHLSAYFFIHSGRTAKFFSSVTDN